MKKDKPSKKLALSRETIIRLTERDLRRAVGGDAATDPGTDPVGTSCCNQVTYNGCRSG
jgi:hypothetical protein